MIENENSLIVDLLFDCSGSRFICFFNSSDCIARVRCIVIELHSIELFSLEFWCIEFEMIHKYLVTILLKHCCFSLDYSVCLVRKFRTALPLVSPASFAVKLFHIFSQAVLFVDLLLYVYSFPLYNGP